MGNLNYKLEFEQLEKEFEAYKKGIIKKFEDLISDVYNNPKFDKKRTEDFTQFVMLIESELKE
jgi:hypothetical protein